MIAPAYSGSISTKGFGQNHLPKSLKFAKLASCCYKTKWRELMMGLKTSEIITINKDFTQVFRVFAIKNIEFQRMNNFAWNCLDKN